MPGLNTDSADNELLFGRAGTPAIIAIEHNPPKGIQVYLKERWVVRSQDQAFSPFIFLADHKLLQGWKGEYQLETLEGKEYYKYLLFLKDWEQTSQLAKHLAKKAGCNPSQRDAPFYFINDPVHQHLLLTGQTLFLKMDFSRLSRMQIDIETYCAAGFEFSNPNREEDRIIIISLADNSGWERVISGKDFTEKDMLVELVRLVQERDPDIIEGHNIFRFDLDYIQKRAQRHKVELELGRDGSLLRGHPSRLNIAERIINYPKYEIYGRHIVDTWFLVQFYDISVRSMEGHGLKEAAHHFGLSAENRTFLDPAKISWYFAHEFQTLYAYALDDVRETRALSELLSQSYFFQAQIFPYSYQNTVLRGNATKINSLLLREYIYQRYSLPHPPTQERSFAGGYTDIFYQGMIKNVLHCDVQSLYPSIMLTYHFFPEKDGLGVLFRLLKDLRQFRLKAKKQAREATTARERNYFDVLQSTLKILINSFYGYLGTQQGHFSDTEVAEKITAKGREIIKEAVDWLREQGCLVVEIDTDGIYFVPPKNIGTIQEEELVQRLSNSLPEGINMELDGCYPSMFSYKIKNYVLLDHQDKLIIKGSGLKSRGLELYLRKFMNKMFHLLLKGEWKKIEPLFQRYWKALANHEWDKDMFIKTESLQDSLTKYQEKVKAGRRNVSALYELALKSGRPYQPGDQLSFYVTGQGKNVKVYENCKSSSQWDPLHPDENIEYYQNKLLELYERFKPFCREG